MILLVGLALATLRLETEMFAEELQHVVLKTISNVVCVSFLVLFKAICDAMLVKHIVQFGPIETIDLCAS